MSYPVTADCVWLIRSRPVTEGCIQVDLVKAGSTYNVKSQQILQKIALCRAEVV